MRPMMQKKQPDNSGYFLFCNNARGFWLWGSGAFGLRAFSYKDKSLTPLEIPWSSIDGVLLKVTLQPRRITINDFVDMDLTKTDAQQMDVCEIGHLKEYDKDYNYARMQCYAIRVYNRILADEEFDFNNTIDKERFGIE